MSKVTDSRLKTHEVMLGATTVNMRDRALFQRFSGAIRMHGLIAPYTVVNAEGLEVNMDPVASSVARYSTQRDGLISSEPALQALLPVCFCNSQNTDRIAGGVMWIQCENAECCVSFRDGWAHRDCALQPGRAIPEFWMCPGCETGSLPVLTHVSAGCGTVHEVRRSMVGHNLLSKPKTRLLLIQVPRCSGELPASRLMLDLQSILNTGDFPTPNAHRHVKASSAVTAQNMPKSIILPTDSRGMPIMAAMGAFALDSIGSDAYFTEPIIQQVSFERYGTIRATNPTHAMSKAAASQLVTRSSAIACAAREAAATGVSGRSAKVSRAALDAAGPLLSRIQIACKNPDHPCHAWSHALMATMSSNPLDILPVETIAALAALFDVTEHGHMDTLESKLKVSFEVSSSGEFMEFYILGFVVTPSFTLPLHPSVV